MAAAPPPGPKPRPPQLAITPTTITSAAASPAGTAAPSPASTVSTPTSITPQLAIKPSASGAQASAMAAVALQSALPPKSSVTSREWVVPPRPKPGRKPATDTPPTKRKAQNRAAQRAFRERRAARVGELEEQLDEINKEHERAEEALQDQVDELKSQVQALNSKNSSLEDALERERAEKNRISCDYDALRRRWQEEGSGDSSRNPSLPSIHSRSQGFYSQHQTPRSSITSEHRNSTGFHISQIISPPESSTHGQSAGIGGCGSCKSNGPCACVDEVLDSTSASCGKCSLGSRCECLETALNGPSYQTDADLKRRPSSPTSMAPDEKRQKSDHYPNEIDFTHAFSKKREEPEVLTSQPPSYQPVSQVLIPPRESCGFCSEGTYCMCAEAAAAPQSLPPMSHQVQTPPPETDSGPSPFEITSTGAVKLPSIRSLNRNQGPRKTGGCGSSGPGTCAQCVADPKSGLFCRSLAASFAQKPGSKGAGGGCCGGASAAGGCCKSKGSGGGGDSGGSVPIVTGGDRISLSCADAYKTLSSHRNFERAADSIGDWLPKLRAIPQPKEVGSSSRSPLEVETASIMSVLKGFDVRFGRDA